MNIFISNSRGSCTTVVEAHAAISQYYPNGVYANGAFIPSTQCFSIFNDGQVIYPIVPVLGGIKIIVRQMTGETLELDIPDESPILISEIKQRILEKISIPIISQNLYKEGILLKNDSNTQDYSLKRAPLFT